MKKLNMGKVGLTLSLVSVLSVSMVFPALADWEQQADGKWKYLNDDGSYASSSLVDGYYVNGDGIWITDFVEWKDTGSWRNENVAKQIGSEIQKEKEWRKNPIQFNSTYASFGNASSGIELQKIKEKEFQLTLYVRLTTDINQKGVRALTYLICGDDTLYNAIFNSYEGDNDLYNINYDDFVQVGSYQIKATLGQNGNSMIYTIKEN